MPTGETSYVLEAAERRTLYQLLEGSSTKKGAPCVYPHGVIQAMLCRAAPLVVQGSQNALLHRAHPAPTSLPSTRYQGLRGDASAGSAGLGGELGRMGACHSLSCPPHPDISGLVM